MAKIVLPVGGNSGFVNTVFFFNRVDGVYLLSLSMFGAEFGFADVHVSLSFKEVRSP